MNTTARISTLLSTLLLAAAPAMAATPSGVGEFSLHTEAAVSTPLSREAVMAEALNSDVLDRNGEIPQTAQAPRSTLTRATVKAMAQEQASSRRFNSETSM